MRPLGIYLRYSELIAVLHPWLSYSYFSCDQAALRTLLSIHLSHLFHNVPVTMSSWNCQGLSPLTNMMSMQRVKARGQRSKSQRSKQILPQFGLFQTMTPVWITDGYQMMHMAWIRMEEVPYCFSRSSAKYQGCTGQKIAHFEPNWVFPDWNSSLNSPIATKWCTKLEVA